jgi:hypothetical protein
MSSPVSTPSAADTYIGSRFGLTMIVAPSKSREIGHRAAA